MPRRIVSHRVSRAESSLESLLGRMRQRLYPETLPALASFWLRTVCSHNHNKPWWVELSSAIEQAIREERLDDFGRDVLVSVQDWIQRTILVGAGTTPVHRKDPGPPFRTVPAEHLASYVTRLLNEWLPAEVARLLLNESDYGLPLDGGIPVLTAASAVDGLLVRERLAPETLEMLLEPGLLSPKNIYPADVEILTDAVLALLGRLRAPAPASLPATLLGVVAASALPPDYAESVRSASLVQSGGREELHVPITSAQALHILKMDPLRIGSVIVTMDGRSWQPSRLHSGEENVVVYAHREPLRIDFTADHAKLSVPWPEIPVRWSGAAPPREAFELFGREWQVSSWEMRREVNLLHLTFRQILPIPNSREFSDSVRRSYGAAVDMAWSELERALSESLLQKDGAPLERLRRTDLVPLGRALYALSESVHSHWLPNQRQVENRLRAVRFHHSAIFQAYGRSPWRVLPEPVKKRLSNKYLSPASIELLRETFRELPPVLAEAAPHTAQHPTPSRAA